MVSALAFFVAFFWFNKVSVTEFNDFCMILVAPAKPIHSSQDLISLLHLDTLYNTYVRPFADLPGEEGQPGAGAGGNDAFQRGKKKGTSMPGRKKMEKGYQHLIEDCIGELYRIIRHLDSHTLREDRRMCLWDAGRPNTAWIQERQPFIVTTIERYTLPTCTSTRLITRANRGSSKGGLCDCKVGTWNCTGWGKDCFSLFAF